MGCKVEGSKGTICQIPAGKFKMGSENGELNEQPVRDVELSEFWMQKHGVTVNRYKTYVRGAGEFLKSANALLQDVIKETKINVTVKPIALPSMPDLPDGFGGDKQPMVMVSWQEARDYCRFYGMDLPTEAQRERAARGHDGKKKYGTKSGDLSHAEAVYEQKTTAPVCSKPENDLGLCDVAGNVWEWTMDWYQEDAYKTMAAKNPKGPSRGKYKVIRGGSWGDGSGYAPHSLRAVYRSYDPPDVRNNGNVGFRCVVRPQDSKK